MTKQEVLNLIYTKKNKGLDFTEEEKKQIANYYSDKELSCMNRKDISINSCVVKKPTIEDQIGSLSL